MLLNGRISQYLRNSVAKKTKPESDHQDSGLPIQRKRIGQYDRQRHVCAIS